MRRRLFETIEILFNLVISFHQDEPVRIHFTAYSINFH